MRFPIPKGSLPESPIAGRRREVTELLLRFSHITPVHEQGLASEIFHRSKRPPRESLRVTKTALSKARYEETKKKIRGKREKDFNFFWV